MSTYLTIKEAADRAGKAEITVRRFVQSVVKEKARSQDRKLIQPGPAKVRDLKKRKQPFSWKIADELIVRQFLRDAAAKGARAAQAKRNEDDVLTTLQGELQNKQEQLKVKDEQIEALTGIVQNLNERMREGNVLMASLQKHLSLPEGDAAGTDGPGKKKQSFLARILG